MFRLNTMLSHLYRRILLLFIWSLITGSFMTGCSAKEKEASSSLANNDTSPPEVRSKESAASREVYQKAAELIARFLQEQHFAKHPLDESTSKEWIEAYMKGLDYNHLFFLQSDLETFEKKYSSTLGKKVSEGDLAPAFEIFDVFRQRLNARLDWVAGRMNKSFDFSPKDYYIPDRGKVLWPSTQKEADTLWEQKIKYDLLGDRLADKKEADPLDRLKKRYNQLRKTFGETDDEEIIQTYLSSLTMLYDPHSQYLGPGAMEDFAINMNNSLVGIGAVLTTEEGYCTIKEIIPGGPADLDKRLKVNDRIVGVAQGSADYVDIVDMKLRYAVRLIRGEKGSTVRLNVIPAAADSSTRNEIKLVRDEIQLNNQRAKAKLIEQKGAQGETLRLGIIDLPSFYGPIDKKQSSSNANDSQGTTDDVRVLLEKLKEKKIDGLVLDLRNNGGGLLGEAVRLVGLFIDKGPVVQIKDPQNRIQKLEDQERGALYDGPLIVLTNKLSASASEIAAGALQNYGRAVIVGDKSTHGKGTVQTVTEINNFILPVFGKKPEAGAVKLTIQKFYLPNGHSTQNRGVVPDIILPSMNDYLELGEEKLPHALAWDEIPSSNFNLSNDKFAQLLQPLNTSSKERIEKDADFKLLFDDIERLKKRLEDKKVSLNEQERKEEKNQDKKRIEDRKQTIKALSKNSPSILNITFDNLEGSTEAPKVIGMKARLMEEDSENEDGKKEEEATPAESFAADLHLRETLRILTDFIGLQSKAAPKSSLAVKP
jgi:carboxyl-terminal processing protease